MCYAQAACRFSQKAWQANLAIETGTLPGSRSQDIIERYLTAAI